MQVMTRVEEEVLRKLVALARGDATLVERAFRASIQNKDEPDLADVVDYIERDLAGRSASKVA
jgi:hypothetical protein